MFLLLLGASPTTTSAQCPTTVHPTVGEPHYVPWQRDSLRVIDPVLEGCEYWVYYCHRFIDSFPCIPPPPPNDSFTCTTIQRYVESVVQIKDTNNSNPDPCGGTLSVIAKATDTVWKLPPDTTLPPCGSISAPDMTVITNACWILKDHYPPMPADTANNIPARPERWVFGPCNVGEQSLCYMTCKICQDDEYNVQTILRFNCTWQNSGVPDCNTLSYDPKYPPYPDMLPECFKVPCSEHP
jgi:hypothetical protein